MVQRFLPEERLTVEQAIEHPFVTKNGTLPPIDISIVASNENQENIDPID